MVSFWRIVLQYVKAYIVAIYLTQRVAICQSIYRHDLFTTLAMLALGEPAGASAINAALIF